MHFTLDLIISRLNESIVAINNQLQNDDPIAIHFNNWSFPCINRHEIIKWILDLIKLIEENDVDNLGDAEQLIASYPMRIQFLNDQTIPQIQNQANIVVESIRTLLDGLHNALIPLLELEPETEEENRKEIVNIRNRIRNTKRSLDGLVNRTTPLNEMIERIEYANSVADQIPIDLKELSDARANIQSYLQETISNRERVSLLNDEAETISNDLKEKNKEIDKVLVRCESAYAASTSVGLAASFDERSEILSRQLLYWVGSLVFALSAIVYFGGDQIRDLDVFLQQTDISVSAMFLNTILSFLSVGAPVWLAWLSTKQIGQRFRLSEDYAYKAAISRAYEGYRREAARFSGDMQVELLRSALNHLDEFPLRLVEERSYGSPWQELASSSVLQKAMRIVPGFKDQVIELAKEETEKDQSNPQ